MVARAAITPDEFEVFVAEHPGRMFELISGEIIEASPGRTSNSAIEHTLAILVRLFCRDHQLPCYTSGGDGAYNIQGNVIAPDFAYKRTPMNDIFPDPEPPLWAVEIISPTDKAPDIREKRHIYLQADILYWEMYPQSYSIDVYAPGKPVQRLGIDDTLDGGDVLPDLKIAVKDIFPARS
ncbi:MAG: Uma2 family endonuclease [Anaerolineae bacterium]|nr:Uma2 family endonuclease [Anaerolineae bacterium]